MDLPLQTFRSRTNHEVVRVIFGAQDPDSRAKFTDGVGNVGGECDLFRFTTSTNNSNFCIIRWQHSLFTGARVIYGWS